MRDILPAPGRPWGSRADAVGSAGDSSQDSRHRFLSGHWPRSRAGLRRGWRRRRDPPPRLGRSSPRRCWPACPATATWSSRPTSPTRRRCATMVDDAAARLGGLDVLVNNAASYGRAAHPVAEVSYQDWQQVWRDTIGLNLIGAANVTWCAVQHMIAGGGGTIVNVSSRGAFRGEPGQPAYGASKAGLNALGQSLAVALAPHNIVVSAVAPGFVQTDMAASASAERRRRRDPRAEPVRPGRRAGRDRGRGDVPGVAGGTLGQRRDPGPQRRVLPAHLTARAALRCWRDEDDDLRGSYRQPAGRPGYHPPV